MGIQKNPKIIHRIYFENFAPFHDPFDHYLDSWRREMPDYTIMKWGKDNLDVRENEWTSKAFDNGAPVFLSEYFRWKVLAEYGGIYLDADCEIVDGKVLHSLIEDLYAQNDYDVFFGVEERANGHPTAQTVAAKKGADLIGYMKDLYQDRLAPFWHWREQRGLIGPQLMSLYFRDRGANVADDGFFKNIDEPVISHRAKIYPQKYFSPKFSILGDSLAIEDGKTCVYHMFANSNVDFSDNKKLDEARKKALTFSEYRAALERVTAFPRQLHSSHFTPKLGKATDKAIIADRIDGLIFYGPYFSLPEGRYIARLKCPVLSRIGVATVSVTEGSGVHLLAKREFHLKTIPGGPLNIPFEVAGAAATQLEITLSVSGIDRIEFEGAEIDIDRQDQSATLSSAVAPRKSLKILHRVYFGFDGKPDQFQTYLETWRTQLPDFEIMHWNASNLPMDINPYVRQLYAEKDHAFLTDFFRWYLLKEYGGTYLDADVEVVDGSIYRNLIEELADSKEIEAFIGIDEKGGGWYTAHSMASKPNSDLAAFMCDLYANFGSFTAWRKKGLYFWAPQLVGLYFANRGHHKDGMGTTPRLDSPVVISGVKIYPQDWFSPLAPSGDGNQPFRLNGYSVNTCLCHHFACSWHDADSIYLDHSKKKGGQANVLLGELLEKSGNRTFLTKSGAISTVVGLRNDEGISTTGVPGRLSYGPYICVLEGNYLVSFSIDHLVSLGKVTVEVSAGTGDHILASSVISEADLQAGLIELEFNAPQVLEDVEFRMEVSEDSNFHLSKITMKNLFDKVIVRAQVAAEPEKSLYARISGKVRKAFS